MINETLAAERALGRLVQQREDTPADLASVLDSDELRFESIMSLGLDGRGVAVEDVATAQINPLLLPGAKQPAAEEALHLIRTIRTLRRGLTANAVIPTPVKLDDGVHKMKEIAKGCEDTGRKATDKPLSPIQQKIQEALAASRASRADLEDYSFDLKERAVEPIRSVPDRQLLIPLSADWLVKAWTLLTDAEVTPEQREALERAAADIDTAVSSNPGMPGVARALHALHRERYWPTKGVNLSPEFYERAGGEVAEALFTAMTERQLMGPELRFVRLVTPWIIGRACRLPGPGPFISEALWPDRLDYARASVMGPNEWQRILSASLADGWTMQRDRLPRLRRRLSLWGERLGLDDGSRRRTRGPGAALLHLADQRVLNPESLAAAMGVKAHRASGLLSEMAALGLLHRATRSKNFQIFWVNDVEKPINI